MAGTMATKWSQPSGGGWRYDDVLTDYVTTLNSALAGLDNVIETCVQQLVRALV